MSSKDLLLLGAAAQAPGKAPAKRRSVAAEKTGRQGYGIELEVEAIHAATGKPWGHASLLLFVLDAEIGTGWDQESEAAIIC